MKAKKLAQVIRQIVREEVQKEVRNVLTEQKAKDNSNVGSMSLNEALSQTESEAYPTMKTFSAQDARAGFAALQDDTFNTPNMLTGHNGQAVPASNVDPSVSKALTRDYSDLVKRFKK